MKASGTERVRAKTKPKQIPLELPAELRLDLAVFCAHHYDSPMVVVIRRALQAFLDEQQRMDPEFDRLLASDRQARLPVVPGSDKFTPQKK
jgi:hypothetical protein